MCGGSLMNIYIYIYIYININIYIYINTYIHITKKQKAKLAKIYLKYEIWNLSTMKHSLEKDFIFHSDIYFSAGFASYFLDSDT